MTGRANGYRDVVVNPWAGPGEWHMTQAVAPERKGYHYTHVITPDIAGRVSDGSRAALARWERRGNGPIPIAWVGSDRVSWITAQEAQRRDRILRLVTHRTRGLRTTQRALAARLGVPQVQVSRTIRNLERLGFLEVVTTRGRNGWTKLRRGLYHLVPTSRESLRTRADHFRAAVRALPAWRHPDELRDGEVYVPPPRPPDPPRAPELAPEPVRESPDWPELVRARAYRSEVNREVFW